MNNKNNKKYKIYTILATIINDNDHNMQNNISLMVQFYVTEPGDGRCLRKIKHSDGRKISLIYACRFLVSMRRRWNTLRNKDIERKIGFILLFLLFYFFVFFFCSFLPISSTWFYPKGSSVNSCPFSYWSCQFLLTSKHTIDLEATDKKNETKFVNG